jgi:hypothetical protein
MVMYAMQSSHHMSLVLFILERVRVGCMVVEKLICSSRGCVAISRDVISRDVISRNVFVNVYIF